MIHVSKQGLLLIYGHFVYGLSIDVEILDDIEIRIIAMLSPVCTLSKFSVSCSIQRFETTDAQRERERAGVGESAEAREPGSTSTSPPPHFYLNIAKLKTFD